MPLSESRVWGSGLRVQSGGLGFGFFLDLECVFYGSVLELGSYGSSEGRLSLTVRVRSLEAEHRSPAET